VFTFLSEENVEDIIQEHNNDKSRRLLQNKIAEIVTIMVHSEQDLNNAIKASKVLFGKSSKEDLESLDEKTFNEIFEGVPSSNISLRKLSNGIDIENSFKILCVDDEPDILEILKYNLSNEGYNVSTAKDGELAIKEAKESLPNLIIMDVMMPNMDGIEACEILRKDQKFNDTIIMFLTARGEDFSHLAAYEAGADDYVTKPVKPKVLLSKVKSLLRRYKKVLDSEINKIEFENIKIDRETYRVYVSGESINLPRKEFELLYLLASKPDKVFKREKIMEKVWGGEVVVGDRTIDVHIRKLREKIGDKFFKTVKGVGYKFVIN
jgi:two-component system alkaline phosphatase synthesis response regulator PhoP